MKGKRILAGLMALMFVFGAAAVPETVKAVNTAVSASADTYEDFDYYIEDEEEHTIIITAYHGDAEELIIPSEINGYTVVGISGLVLDGDENTTLKRVVVPDTVVSLGYAFSLCKALTDITIPSSVTHISGNPFWYTPWLENKLAESPAVVVNNILVTYDTEAKEAVIPDGVTAIADYAFRGCPIESVKIPDSVTSIGVGAFSGCDNLSEVDLPVNLKELGYAAFSSCYELRSVTIPDGVTKLNGGTFSGCENLENITIPAGLTEFSHTDFEETKWLNNKLDKEQFAVVNGILFDVADLSGDVVVPEGVKHVADYAFHNNDGITGITFPKSLETVSENAIYELSKLKDVTFRSDALTIDEDAISDCPELESLTIPEDLTTSYESNDYIYFYENIPKSITVHGKNGTSKWTVNDGTLTITGSGEMTVNPFKEFIGDYDNKFDFSKITKVVVGDGITSVADSAFGYRFKALETVELPDSVTKIGSEAFSDCGSLEKINIPKGLTSIGDNAFFYCQNLKNIKLPETLTKLGDDAFSSCSSIKEMTLPASLTEIGYGIFSSCTALEKVDLPDGITEIPHNMFDGCGALKNIEIPSSVNKIGGRAFYECKSLTEVTIPKNVTYIGDYAFCECDELASVDIPETVTYIGQGAFVYTKWLDSQMENSDAVVVNGNLLYMKNMTGDIVIPDGVTTIPDRFAPTVVRNDTSITSVTMPDSVTYIGLSAFWGRQISSVKFSKNLKEIGDYAFCWTALKEAELPEGLETIGECAFYGTNSLEKVTIPSTVTDIGGRAFSGTSWLESKKQEDPVVIINDILIDATACEGKVVIPDGVKKIAGNAFYATDSDSENKTSKVTEVVVPSTVKSIGNSAFEECESLKSVTLGNGLETIGRYAFYSTGLTSIKIPDSVTEIGEKAFFDCKDLKSVTVPATVTNIGEYALGFYYDSDRNKQVIEDFVINGTAGSAAEKYAKENGIHFNAVEPVGMLGDLNDDGKINVTDISKAAAHVKGIRPLDANKQKLADVNKDGKLNAADITRLAAHVKGIRKIG